MAPARCSRPISVISSPLRPLRHGRHGVDVDDGVVAGAALDEIDQRHLVDHRIGVGHDDDGGDAAGGGGVARRLQRLAVLGPGSPVNTCMSIRPGHSTWPLQSMTSAPSGALRRRCGAEIGDDAVLDQQAARLVALPEPGRSGAR